MEQKCGWYSIYIAYINALRKSKNVGIKYHKIKNFVYNLYSNQYTLVEIHICSCIVVACIIFVPWWLQSNTASYLTQQYHSATVKQLYIFGIYEYVLSIFVVNIVGCFNYIYTQLWLFVTASIYHMMHLNIR